MKISCVIDYVWYKKYKMKLWVVLNFVTHNHSLWELLPFNGHVVVKVDYSNGHLFVSYTVLTIYCKNNRVSWTNLIIITFTIHIYCIIIKSLFIEFCYFYQLIFLVLNMYLGALYTFNLRTIQCFIRSYWKHDTSLPY